MLYVDYPKFMLDIQSELNIKLPEYKLYSGFFDDKNFISCNRKHDDVVLMEVSIDHNENYSKNTVVIKIPFEIVNNVTQLNYPINNKNIVDTISMLDQYYPVFYVMEMAHLESYLGADGFITSFIIIKSDLVLIRDLDGEISYMLENIFFDFSLVYKASVYHTISTQVLLKKIDDKLKSNYYINSNDYINLSMPERIRLYHIAEQLKKSLKAK